jgi:hypothetical protein
MFAGSLVVMILVGVIREMTSRLPHVIPGSARSACARRRAATPRQILAAQGTIVAFLIAGDLLAGAPHPRNADGCPAMINPAYDLLG